MGRAMCCNDSASEPLLGRKNEQRSIEGTRTARTVHGSRAATPECNTRPYALLHSRVALCVGVDPQAVAAPPVSQQRGAHRAHARRAWSRAWRRCDCARSTSLMLYKRFLALRPSNARILHILFMRRPCARLWLPVCLRVQVTDEFHRSVWCSKGTYRCSDTCCVRLWRGKR